MRMLANLLSIATAALFLGSSFLLAKDVSVAYKTKKTVTQSFRETAEAEKHLQALKKLGCKVSSQQAEDSIVIQYECPKWRVVSVSSEKLAHQWEKWLRRAGFDIVHGHSEDHEDSHEHHAHSERERDAPQKGHSHDDQHAHEQEELQYRLPRQVTLHPEQEGAYQELIAILKGLGCTLDIDSHDGHTDIIVQCRSWRHAEFSSHQSAQEWEKWLKGFGFEVKHSHDHH